MYRKDEQIGLTILGYLALIAIVVFLIPILSFCCGLVAGTIIKITFGDVFVNGLTFIGVNITKDQLPLLCGTLGVVGSFFHGSSKFKFDKKD